MGKDVKNSKKQNRLEKLPRGGGIVRVSKGSRKNILEAPEGRASH